MPLPTLGRQTSIFGSRVGRRLLFLFLGCALAPLAAFGWFALTQVSTQLRDEMERTLHRSAKQSGMELANHLLGLADELDVALDLRRSAEEGIGSASVPLRDRLLSLCSSIAVQDGATLRTELGEDLALPPLAAEELQHLQAGKWLTHVDPGADASGARVTMQHLLHPTDPASPRFVATLRPEQLRDIESMRGSGAEVLVLTASGTVVASSIPVPDLAPMRAKLAREPAAATFDWQVGNDAHLARYWRVFLRPQLGLDWFVIQSSDRQAAMARLQTFQTTFVLVAMLTLLLVMAASLLQIRNTLTPIRRLVETTHRVIDGDFDARTGLQTPDEFGQMGRAFDAMTEQLVENIQERELTEIDLIAARDAALDAVRAKADFLTNVSHELRTPLTSLVSSAEILRTFGDDPTTRSEFLDIVVDQTARLRELIEGALHFSTPAEAMEPTSLPSTIHAAVELLQEQVQHRVDLQIAPDLPPVMASAYRLVHLWRHLLHNAAKFSAEDTAITLSARSGNGQCIVEIVDRGIGIPADELDLVFEPFHQGNRNLITDKVVGFGLGLTLARNIAESHGGRIEVHSEVGKGSTFRVRLPCLQDAARRTRTDDGAPTAAATSAAEDDA